MAKWYDNDDFLLRRLASDDGKAMEFLYRQYSAELLSVSNTIVKDQEQAKDIVQEVFTYIWDMRHSLKISRSVRSYLTRAVTNRSLNFIRDYPSMHRLPLDSLRKELYAAPEDDPFARLEAMEIDMLKDWITQQLPPQCRTIYKLSRVEGMSYKEISEALDISDKAVEKQVSKALKRVRDFFKPYLKSLIF